MNAIHAQTSASLGGARSRIPGPPLDGYPERLADYVRAAARRRDLAVEDLAVELSALAKAHRASRGPEATEAALPLLEAVVATFRDIPQPIQVECDPALRLPVADLACVGMILGEAISNAAEHGFPVGRDGRVWVKLCETDGRIALTVRDNGIGMPDLQSDERSGHGLVEALARLLGGYARLGSAPFGGALVTVAFPRRR